ncbi:MAG: type II toxin-antitoxin system RelB/DinJ family antitoxin [Bifidobacteriaceae bacterium]|jgi:DNA-damage-inducible protein J|nr:type II toxin-antitoxin system RelB/DinJ family antitoxin [Bifidobacteriaceae bacterium]
MTADTTVRARLDSETKERALAVLDRIGLNASDLIRLTFRRVADEGRIPFALAVPNQVTRAALDELGAGGGTAFASVKDLIADLDE